MLYPIYTETTSCRDCYKCVRSCPVKAIQIKDGNAMILKERCIFCGKCVHICPNNAKKVRDDVDRVKLAIESSGRKVVCSLAPSFASEYKGYEAEYLTALKTLGFSLISETAIGAAIVSEATDIYASKHDGIVPWISTACPSVVELVKKYYPEKVKRLSPIPSPLQVHSAYLRHLYGEDIIVVFIGPCIAKKIEAETTPGYPDFALSFKEVDMWMERDGLVLSDIKADPEVRFMPSKAGVSTIYPIEAGQIKSSEVWRGIDADSHAVAISGMDQIIGTLSSPSSCDDIFIEMLGCDGGCINGPGTDRNGSVALRKRDVADYTLNRVNEEETFRGDKDFSEEVLRRGYGIIQSGGPAREDGFKKDFSEETIKRTLIELGKLTKADELNCGGCGYSTCREMAIAYLGGMAEAEMCVTKMRKEAESKVDVLLRTIPNGIVIVDSDMKIADCNTRFLDLFGDMEEGFVDQNVLNMVRGLPVERFIPFADKFKDQFYLSHPGQYRMHYRDKFLRVTFFLVEKKRLLGAMFEDITSPTVRRETVVKKAEDVIQKSLETVQQIASLLGENAAETEIMLNSLIEAFSVHGSVEEGEGFTQDNDGDLS